MQAPKVGIVGGGLAAVSAALTLLDHGAFPIVIERSAYLGGRAGSHPGRNGNLLDVGQHVYLGCCTAYRRLLVRLGTDHLAPLTRRIDFALVDGLTGRMAPLRAAALPYPLSLAGALLRYEHLDLADRWATLRLVRRAQKAYRSGEGRHMTFGAWLAKEHASSSSIAYLWEPLIVAALNATPDEVSAYNAFMVIAQGLAGGATSAAVGLPRAPLAELLDPLDRIVAHNGEVRRRTKVHSLKIDEHKAIGVNLGRDEHLACDAVIVATGPNDALRLLPREWQSHPFFERVSRLDLRPIVNVHLWYDRPVLPRPMVGVVRSPLQWLFDLTALYSKPSGEGYHIAISLSAAEEWMALPGPALRERFVAEMARTFAPARDARIVRATVRKVRTATFACTPGHETMRPTNETPIKHLFLAGDYTQTGWPSTMESAVLSGEAAALAALRALRSPS